MAVAKGPPTAHETVRFCCGGEATEALHMVTVQDQPTDLSKSMGRVESGSDGVESE